MERDGKGVKEMCQCVLFVALLCIFSRPQYHNHRLCVAATGDLQARAIEPQEVTGHEKERNSFCSGLFQASSWSVRKTMSVVHLSQEFWLHQPRLLCPLVRELAEFTKKQFATTVVYCIQLSVLF